MFRLSLGSTFNLRVQVSDMLTRRPLSQAAAELFVNRALNSSALSGDDGSVRLRVPFQPGLPVSVVATKRGFLPAVLPCKTTRIPSEFESLNSFFMQLGCQNQLETKYLSKFFIQERVLQ